MAQLRFLVVVFRLNPNIKCLFYGSIIALVSEGEIVILHKNVWDIEAYAYDYSLYEDPDTPIERVEEPKVHTCNNVSEFFTKDLVADEYKCVLCADGFYELELKHRYYFDLNGKWNYQKV